MQRHFSRPFDGYNQAGNRFGENNAQSNLRYETVRDAFDGPLPNGPLNNPAFPYDITAAQTWNAGPPQMQNYGNGHNGLQTFGGMRGVKPPPRPRADMPTVSTLT